jgi:hypothetical protein
MVEYLKKTEGTESLDPQQVLERDEVKAYGQAVTNLFDAGEDEDTLQDYKDSVVQLLFTENETHGDVRSGEQTKNEKDDHST